MPNKTQVTVCPNPKCHREIEEPILLNVLSATPAEQYQACPYCFFKLETYTELQTDTEQESGPPSQSPLKKVLDAISTKPQKETEEEKPTKEEPSGKPFKEEVSSSGCPHHFGYLASRPKNNPIPQECLTCQKIVDCMLKVGAN